MKSYDCPAVQCLNPMFHIQSTNQCLFNLTFTETQNDCGVKDEPQSLGVVSIVTDSGTIEIRVDLVNVTFVGTIDNDGNFVASGDRIFEEDLCTKSNNMVLNGVFTGSSLSGTFQNTSDKDDEDPDCATSSCADINHNSGLISATPV